MMREWKSEATLKAWASEQAAWISRRDENGNYQGMTESREDEREIVFKVIYGALLGLNWGEATRSDPGREQAIVDTAEFTFNLLVENISPEARGKVSDLKGILKRQFPGIVWCVVWSVAECEALEECMNSAKVMQAYGDRELTGLYAFNDKIVLEVK